MSLVRIIATVAGTVFGAFLGAPWLGMAIGSQIGGYYDRRKEGTTKVDMPRLDGIRFQQSSFGIPIPQVYGTFRIAGNVIWAAPLREQKTITTENDITTTTYAYFGNFAIGICKGPIDAVRKIWADSKLIYDLDAENDEVVAIPGLIFRLYLGTETQMPDPGIEGAPGGEAGPFVVGDGNLPAFRGLAYIVFAEFPCSEFGGRMPSFTFEVVNDRTDLVPWESVGVFPPDAWGTDSIVLLPDGIHAVFKMPDGQFYKVDMIKGELVLVVPASRSLALCNIDVDEEGNIYAVAAMGQWSYATLQAVVKYNGSSLSEIAVGVVEDLYGPIEGREPPYWPLSYVELVVVSNPEYPFLFLIESWYGGVHMRNRSSLSYSRNFSAPADTDACSLSVDDVTGACWVAFSGDGGYYIGRIQPAKPSASSPVLPAASFTLWDIGAHVESGDFLHVVYHPASQQLLVFVSEGAESPESSADPPPSGVACLFYDCSFFVSSDIEFISLISAADGLSFMTWSESYWRQGVTDDGYLYFATAFTDNRLQRIDVWARTLDRTYVPDQKLGYGLVGGGIYHPLTHSVLQSVNTTDPDIEFVKILLDRFTESGATLSSIVTALCAQVGLLAGDIDVSDLTTTIVPGFYIGQRVSARGAIESLAAAYFFDAVESDGKLKFHKRGSVSSVVTIPEEHLAAHNSGEDRPTALLTIRQQELELPQQVDVIYAAQAASYDPATQRARRLLTNSTHKATLTLPLSLTDSTAANIAMNHLVLAWMQRVAYVFQVSRSMYAYLDPADVITVEEGGNSHLVRIERLGYNGNLMTIEASADGASAYDADLDGAGGPGNTGHDDPIEYYGLTFFALVDAPLLYAGTDTPGVYYVATSGSADWPGASIYKSHDGGATWQLWSTATRNGVVGEALTVLGDVADPFVWDRGNTVRIMLFNDDDSIASATELEVLNGSNTAMLGSEVIRYTTATLVSKGVYDLSGLMRGQRGTDFATGAHAIGESFALIVEDQVHFAPYGLAYANIVAAFRAVTDGSAFSEGVNRSASVLMRNVMPLSPQHVRGTRSAAGDVTITWIRRSRFGGQWDDLVDVPLGETTESYEIECYAVPSGLVGGGISKTLTATSETVTYSAAEQLADGITPGRAFQVTVYQISSVRGRGEPSATVTV